MPVNSSQSRRRRWRRWLFGAGILAAFLLVFSVVAWATTDHFAALGGRPSPAELARMKRSPRYADGHLSNEQSTSVMTEGSLGAVWNWLFGGEMRVPICALPLFAY